MFHPLPYPPLPSFGRRARRSDPASILLTCPRLCPQWQRNAMMALVKPKPFRKEAILHRKPAQHWPADADALIDRALSLSTELNFFPTRTLRRSPGDYHLLIEFPPD